MKNNQGIISKEINELSITEITVGVDEICKRKMNFNTKAWIWGRVKQDVMIL